MNIAEKLTTISQNEQKIYDKSRNDEYSSFWDSYQNSGNRTNYENAFAGAGWNDANFKPKHNMYPTSTYMMFRGTDIPEIYDKLDQLGITLDTNKCSVTQYMFYSTVSTTRIGTLDISNPLLTSLMFNSKIVTIDKLICSERTVFSSSTFQSINSLKNMIVEGTIAVSFSITAASALSLESAKSIINALKDYSETDKEFAYSVSFHNNVWKKLDADGAAAPSGKTWREYINSKCWNA